MRTLVIALIALFLASAAFAQTPSGLVALSMDQQNKISEIVANRTQPRGPVNFPVEVGAVVPPGVALQPLPPEAEALAPQLRGGSYLAVEELVALVDTSSRKIVTVMQRMRRQQSTGSGGRPQ